jgi:hypothetical protein
MERAHEAVHRVGDPVQAYCDLLEVRWLLSEQAGRDIGDDAALAALADHAVPTDAARWSSSPRPTPSSCPPDPGDARAAGHDAL